MNRTGEKCSKQYGLDDAVRIINTLLGTARLDEAEEIGLVVDAVTIIENHIEVDLDEDVLIVADAREAHTIASTKMDRLEVVDNQVVDTDFLG